MASLIEELINVLEEENKQYEELVPVEEKKRTVIIDNDLEALQSITALEQSVIQKINKLEGRRQEVIVNIGTVMSRNPSTLDIKTVVKMLEKQPEEQKRLSRVHDDINRTVGRLKELNDQNQVLIEQSLEMIEFNMNVIQSSVVMPGNNYDRRAGGAAYGNAGSRSMFDAKQ